MTNIPKTYHTHTHAQNTSSFVIPSKTMYALNSLQKEICFVFLLFECVDIYFTPPSSSWIEMFLGMCFNVNWDSKIPTFQQWMSFQIYVTFKSISLSTTVLLQVTSLSQANLNHPIPTKQASKSRPDSRCTWRDDKRFTSDVANDTRCNGLGGVDRRKGHPCCFVAGWTANKVQIQYIYNTIQ